MKPTPTPSPLRLQPLLGPLLASLPAASASPQPPAALLPLLSPILRQRVQLLSTSNTDPWLPLLCYDASKHTKLSAAAQSEYLEPHPVSGEVEVYGDEIIVRYKRVDAETLQALVSLHDIALSVRLVWCVGDELGGGDGWRIGEVFPVEESAYSWGAATITEAEHTFSQSSNVYLSTNGNGNSLHTPDEDEDDDDDYWNQYDKTPGHTPAPKHSPAPPAMGGGSEGGDDAYYAQYETVQPAMDNHDPDEAQEHGIVESSLGDDAVTMSLHESISTSEQTPWSHTHDVGGLDGASSSGLGLAQPRPSSSAGSSGSETVERLERRAEQEGRRGQSEVGVKQHISTSVKSLYRLAKVAGIEREEFERLVRTELDVLSLMDEDDD
jgi:hypothetical protein